MFLLWMPNSGPRTSTVAKVGMQSQEQHLKRVDVVLKIFAG